MKPKLLLIEDNDICVDAIKRILKIIADLYVCSTKEDALNTLKKVKDIPIILCDLGLPDSKGSGIVHEVHTLAPNAYIVVITDEAHPDIAADVIKKGATDYIRKTRFFEDEILLLDTVKKLLDENEVTKISSISGVNSNIFIPELAEYTAVYDQVTVGVEGGLNVLIQGETGCGKNQLVDHIHQHCFPKKALVKVDCGAICTSLAESELFGNEKGAFYGADKSRLGHIARAHEGILFLDEIANASLELQSKLLNVIQNKQVMPLGGTKTIPADFQLICATNRDLPSAIKEGKFRSDLYYRIRQLEVKMPTLRESKAALLEYANFFISKFNRMYKTDFQLTSEFAKLLTSSKWEGNLRQLNSELQTLILFHSKGMPFEKYQQQFSFLNQKIMSSGEIKTYDMESSTQEAGSSSSKNISNYREKQELKFLLEKHRYNVTAMAKAMETKRTTLQSRLKKHELI